MSGGIPFSKRVSYAWGYLALNLAAEARRELAQITRPESGLPPVREARLEVAFMRQDWDTVNREAAALIRLNPASERPWFSHAFALREQGRITKARDVLIRATSLHGHGSAIIWFNLGCYHCLLGDLDAARACLERACRLDRDLHDDAKTDPDYAALRPPTER